jgi:DNA-binding MarR family transcriptional regulator
LKELAEFRYLLRTFLSFSEVASEREGIQAQQYQLMQVIAALPGGEQASISYIAERMVLRHNSTVELVDRAEKAGLVARRNDPKDLRRSLVVLTPTGEELLRRLVLQHIADVRRVGDDLIRAIQGVQQALE